MLGLWGLSLSQDMASCRSCMHRAGTALTANMSAFRLVQSLTQRFAFMTTAGNHEVGSGVHSLCSFFRLFAVPDACLLPVQIQLQNSTGIVQPFQ